MNTRRLKGMDLDRAVADREGITLTTSGCVEHVIDHLNSEFTPYSPSTDWDIGGEIIEREKIQVVYRITDGDGNGYWEASCLFTDVYHVMGDTALVAAMRCYVEEGKKK